MLPLQFSTACHLAHAQHQKMTPPLTEMSSPVFALPTLESLSHPASNPSSHVDLDAIELWIWHSIDNATHNPPADNSDTTQSNHAPATVPQIAAAVPSATDFLHLNNLHQVWTKSNLESFL